MYTLIQRDNIPLHAPLLWRSDANCRPGPIIKMLRLSTPHIAYNNMKWKKIMYHAYYNYKEQ